MTRYTPLICVGEAQAWLALRHNRSTSEWTRLWTKWCWGPVRALFLAGHWIVKKCNGLV